MFQRFGEGAMEVIIANVGDGMCALLSNVDGTNNAQIDWGSASGGKRAYEALVRILGNGVAANVSSFIVTHMHHDDYNGVAYAAVKGNVRWFPEKVFIPRIPDFEEVPPLRRELALITECVRFFGLSKMVGMRDIDLINMVRTVRARFARRDRLYVRGVCDGDVIDMGGKRFVVAWPPRVIGQGLWGVTKRVLDVVREFHRVKEKNIIVKDFYKRISEGTDYRCIVAVDKWLGAEIYPDEVPIAEIAKVREVEVDEMRVARAALKIVNDKLRGVANDLSLVIADGDREVLHMGDLPGMHFEHAIGNVIGRVGRQFKCVVAAHHGTYWDDVAAKLRAAVVAVSNGRLAKRMRKDWGRIGRVLATLIYGDIGIAECVCKFQGAGCRVGTVAVPKQAWRSVELWARVESDLR